MNYIRSVLSNICGLFVIFYPFLFLIFVIKAAHQ